MKQPHGIPEWGGGKEMKTSRRDILKSTKRKPRAVTLRRTGRRNNSCHPHGHWHNTLLHEALTSIIAFDPLRKLERLTEVM